LAEVVRDGVGGGDDVVAEPDLDAAVAAWRASWIKMS
jgi:hypothetical protein